MCRAAEPVMKAFGGAREEVVTAGHVFGLKAGQESEGLAAFGAAPEHLGVVVVKRYAAILAQQHFAEPVMCLAGELGRIVLPV